jgi:hypothetical protein
MTKVPFVFQSAVRMTYFNLLRRYVEEEGLTLDLEHYDEDVIIYAGFLIPTVIVAVIYSHSKWGEPNDLTNESTPRGLNGRKYDGLQITIKNFRYRQRIEKIAENMKRSLEEDVVVEKMPIEMI